MFGTAWDGASKLRLVGVGLSSFVVAATAKEQLGLLDAERAAKLERLAQAADRLRDRFGFSKLQLGGSLPSKARPHPRRQK